jgi:uncharacterized membrane protein
MMWIVWIVILITILGIRSTGSNDIFRYPDNQEDRESPMNIWKRRYASGEITSQEFEKHKGNLEKKRNEKKEVVNSWFSF